jgi:hypothetical protein
VIEQWIERTELVQHSAYRGSSQQRNGATSLITGTVCLGYIARLSSGEEALLLLAHVGYYLPMVMCTRLRDGREGEGREAP